MKIVIGRGGDGLDDKENGVVGENGGQGVAPDGGLVLKDGLPKNPRDEKGNGAKESTEEIVPAVGELLLEAEGEDGGEGAKDRNHERRRRWVGRIPSSARYLARVRRATAIPRSCNISWRVASE